MLDFSFIGKEGLILQYEDVISLTGLNIVRYFQKENVNEKIVRMSVEDILISYLNRETEDVSSWLKTEFDIDINMTDMNDSITVLQPNMLYSYKMFDSAYKNGITNLGIHSNMYSPVIEKFLSTYQIPIKYTHGDIVPVLNRNKNVTFTTSSPSVIKRCIDVDVPFMLTIVDDYSYTAGIIKNHFDDKLRKHNVFVAYTSILSAGMI